MITASHNDAAIKLYRTYVNRLLKSNFTKFNLLNDIPSIDNTKGLIVTPNHCSWWDGFFTEYAMRSFTSRKPFVMMLERQLKKYWFFKYAGAFSIAPSNAESVKESMNYAKSISQSKNDYLIFYPQGEIQPYESSFVKLKKGLTRLTSDSEADVLIIIFKIVYNEEKKPSVYCRFCDLIPAARINSDFIFYEQIFKASIDLLDREIYEKPSKNLFEK